MLSIIIPCYNNGRYLIEMINCFRHQTTTDWELIIVDDGSTDDTPQMVEKAIRDLPNAYFLRRNREPKGSVVCRNIGYDKASGKYVCHLDADDLVSSTFVEHRVAFMENHPDVDYASFPAKRFDNPQKLPKYEEGGYSWGVGDDNDDLLLCFLKGYDYPFSVWNNIYKREAIKELPWDENVRIYTDFSFIVPCILAGLKHKFSGLQEVDYYYRNDSNDKVAMTKNFVSDEKCKSTIYLFTKTLRSFEKLELDPIYKKEFFNFVILHFHRLMMSDATKSKKNIDEFVEWVDYYYHCGIKFKKIVRYNKVEPLISRYRVLSIQYALRFGIFRYIEPFWYSIKRRFGIKDN